MDKKINNKEKTMAKKGCGCGGPKTGNGGK